MSDKSEYMKEKNRSIFRKRVVSEDAPQKIRRKRSRIWILRRMKGARRLRRQKIRLFLRSSVSGSFC